MNQEFSPFLAHLLMSGVARRAEMSAASRSTLAASGGAVMAYSSDILDWGIAAFLASKTKVLLSGPETSSGAKGL